MALPPLSSFKLLSFDCYGTIIDWESGIFEGIKSLLAKSSRSSSWQKSEAVTAFDSVERDLQVRFPDALYSRILQLTYEELAKRLEVPLTEGEGEAFGLSIQNWLPFPDSIEALIRLQKYYKIVILSNVDLSSFSHTAKRLQPFVPDLVITAQEIGSYKPSQENFKYMLAKVEEKFSISEEQVLVTAQSLYHDHQPANALGLRSSWIDRKGGSMGVSEELKGIKYDYRFETLAEMADARESE